MKFTFPRQHKREDVRPLFERLKTEKPALFATLKDEAITARTRLWSEEPSECETMASRHRTIELLKFVNANAGCDSSAAVSYVCADIKMLLFDEIVAELGLPKSQEQLRAERKAL